MNNNSNMRNNLDELLQYSLLVSQGGLAQSEDELIPQGEKIQKAILRFIVRYLGGNLDPNLPLKLYMNSSIEEIWDEDVLEKKIQLHNFTQRISNEIKLSDIRASYIYIQEWNTRQKQLKRPFGPVMMEVK